MKINAIARKAIADKLASAIRREGLTHKEAAQLFNMKSDRVSKFLNDKHRDLISDEFVEPFREWSNSGDSLRVWAKKHNPGVESEQHGKNVITAVNYGGSQVTLHFFEDFDSTKMNVRMLIECLQEVNDGSLLIGQQSTKAEWGASIDEIRELLYDWGKSLNQPDILLATTEEIESKDRLEVILAEINELKSMGFDVDIHISPKQ